MKLRNSTIHPKTIATNQVLPTVEINDYYEPTSALVKFRVSMNRMRNHSLLESTMHGSPICSYDCAALGRADRYEYPRVLTDEFALQDYHNVLAAQLANPAGWGLEPIVDSLGFTLNASKTELKRLHDYLKGKTDFKCVPDQKNRTQYPEENRVRRNYKHSVRLVAHGLDCDPLYVQYGRVKTDSNYKYRPIRISFNPARFTGKELRKSFQLLRNSGVFDDFDRTLWDANITRIDISMDLIALPTPLVIIDTNNISHYGYHPICKDPENDPIKHVQTVCIGGNGRSLSIIYSKVDKILFKKQKHVTSLLNPETNPFWVIRFEDMYKPQKGGKTLKLSELINVRCFIKAKKFYSPLAFRLTHVADKDTALRTGMLRTMLSRQLKVKLSSDEAAAGKFTKKEICEELKNIRKALRRFELYVDRDYLAYAQQKLLQKIYTSIFNIKKVKN